MTMLAAIVALLTVIVPLAIEPPTVERAHISQFGIYEGRVTATEKSGGTVSGALQSVEPKFLSQTTSVPARRGVRFGFQYRLVGEPNGARARIRSITIFPEGGLRNPRTGQVFARSEYIQTVAIGAPVLKGYSIDEEWEVVRGTWVHQIWYGERKLAEMRFTVE
jgi:uncharacterized protein DUF3859